MKPYEEIFLSSFRSTRCLGLAGNEISEQLEEQLDTNPGQCAQCRINNGTSGTVVPGPPPKGGPTGIKKLS
jgi:hypothetical protein